MTIDEARKLKIGDSVRYTSQTGHGLAVGYSSVASNSQQTAAIVPANKFHPDFIWIRLQTGHGVRASHQLTKV